MEIKCPKCGFTRNVSREKLPSDRVVATCPKCDCRFRINTQESARNRQNDEEEEDIRIVASRAYQREADKFATGNESADTKTPSAQGSPWEQAPGQTGWVAAFYQTILRVMFNAPKFFRHLNPHAPINRALLFYLVVICIQILVERLWGEFFLGLLNPGENADPQLEKLLALLSPQTNIALSLLLRTAILVFQLYIFSFLLFLVYRLMVPGRASFALLFQILAYSVAPALLCVIPVIGTLAGTLWSFGCLLAGCRSALGLDWARTLIGFLPIIFLLAPVFQQVLQLMGK